MRYYDLLAGYLRGNSLSDRRLREQWQKRIGLQRKMEGAGLVFSPAMEGYFAERATAPSISGPKPVSYLEMQRFAEGKMSQAMTQAEYNQAERDWWRSKIMEYEEAGWKVPEVFSELAGMKKGK